MPQNKLTIEELPLEIISNTARFLTPQDITRFSKTCKTYYTFFENNEQLKKINSLIDCVVEKYFLPGTNKLFLSQIKLRNDYDLKMLLQQLINYNPYEKIHFQEFVIKKDLLNELSALLEPVNVESALRSKPAKFKNYPPILLEIVADQLRKNGYFNESYHLYFLAALESDGMLFKSLVMSLEFINKNNIEILFNKRFLLDKGIEKIEYYFQKNIVKFIINDKEFDKNQYQFIFDVIFSHVEELSFFGFRIFLNCLKSLFDEVIFKDGEMDFIKEYIKKNGIIKIEMALGVYFSGRIQYLDDQDKKIILNNVLSIIKKIDFSLDEFSSNRINQYDFKESKKHVDNIRKNELFINFFSSNICKLIGKNFYIHQILSFASVYSKDGINLFVALCNLDQKDFENLCLITDMSEPLELENDTNLDGESEVTESSSPSETSQDFEDDEFLINQNDEINNEDILSEEEIAELKKATLFVINNQEKIFEKYKIQQTNSLKKPSLEVKEEMEDGALSASP